SSTRLPTVNDDPYPPFFLFSLPTRRTRPPHSFNSCRFNMPRVHYRAAAAAGGKETVVTRPVARPTVTKPVVTKVTKPVVVVTPKPTKVIPTTTAKVIPPTKILPTTTAPVVPTTSSIIPLTSPTLPLTTITSAATSTLPTLLSTTSTPRTTVAKATGVPTSKVAVASPSSAPATTPSSSTSVTPIIAGIAGSLAGVAVTAILIAFFFRRWNRRTRQGRESINFDPKEFRRSALMLEDPRPHASSVRSVPMDYRQASMAPAPALNQYQQYPVHAPSSPGFYSAPQYFGTPPDVHQYYGSPAVDYHQPYAAPGVEQGYPPPSHRQSSFSSMHPGVAPQPATTQYRDAASPHYASHPQAQHRYAENNEDAYGGI
ncbi:hypothetical protein C8R43DRAFT_524556, partial [Mycena crocata]